MSETKTAESLKKEILDLVSEYHRVVHLPKTQVPFESGKTRIPYAARVFDQSEMTNLVDASLDFWLTSGPWTSRFEKGLAKMLGLPFSLLVNSGSSANLLAFMTLTSPLLKDRRVKRGDEVITVAAGFPTTVAPMIQYGAVPVFVDVTLPTYNIDVTKLELALSPKTKAVMVAHTLGNPYDLTEVKAFCDQNKLWLIEDNCDALGSKYLYQGKLVYTGTVGDIGTSSFYPPHHMTMGEGGAVYMRSGELKKIAESMRDWGRDCWCDSGKDNTCGKRFDWQLGELPKGYDHKYTYSHFGYNLKATDLQASIGVAQLEKVPHFTSARRKNWQVLRDGLKDLESVFILPEATKDSEPSWFGFLLTLKNKVSFTREALVNHLEKTGIQTRMLFAGNLLRHPAFDEMRASGSGYRVVGELTNTDLIMNQTFWLGVYPGMTEAMLKTMISEIHQFVNASK